MKITKQRLLEVLEYDPTSGVFTWKPRINLNKSLWNKPAGTHDHLGYLRIKVDNVQYLAHRLAYVIMTGNEPPEKLDHKDNNPSNCAWDNIRVATSSQNSSNVKTRSDNELGVKNIRKKGENSYQVRVGKNGKSYSKTLKSLEEAIEWRDTKLLELHGDFANNGEN